MAKLGVRKNKYQDKIRYFRAQPKLGAKPYKKKPPVTLRNQPVTIPGGAILAYTIDSPPEAYAQQQGITQQLHENYLAQRTPDLNDAIGGIAKVLSFLNNPKNWLTIGAVIVGILITLLSVNAFLHGEVQSTVQSVAKSQGFKRKRK